METLITLMLLLALVAGVAYWHRRENSLLFPRLSELPEELREELQKTMNMRVIHLLAVGALLAFMVAGIQYKQLEALEGLTQLTAAVEKRQKMDALKAEEALAAAQRVASETASRAAMTSQELLASAPPAPRPAPGNPSATALSVAAAQTPQAPVAQTPLLPGASRPSPLSIEPAPSLSKALTEAAPLDNAAPAAPQSVIEQVYNPERGQAENSPQSAMDDIKKRYEDILVLHLFMSKCGFAQPADYSIITSALAKEISATEAPGRMHADTIETAKSSFNELYAQSPCDGETITPLRQQYQDFVQGLQNNFLADQ